jgi:folate-dependent phosphoribosylglycinamide formyltransferase PurN
LAPIVVNGLVARLATDGRTLTVIEESAESKGEILKRRIRMLGWREALGQAAFGLVQRLLGPMREKRLGEIVRQHGLDTRSPDGLVAIHKVPSVNSEACRALLRSLAPSVVAVYGTRIIRQETLRAVAAPFINYHAGINPKYRGQHPGYWALVAGDAENAGVTIHLVDQGVDTGEVLYQAPVTFSSEDSIATYQHVQAAHALPLFSAALEDALAGRLRPSRVDLPSHQWFPPTLWDYLRTGLAHGVW